MDTFTSLFHTLSATEDDEDDEEDMYMSLSVLGFIITGLEYARQERVRQCYTKRQYLVRSNLLPNPRFGTAWKRLYESQSDRAFRTTMGFDVTTFHAILEAGFASRWNTTPIRRRDVNPKGHVRLHSRSLDAAGGLGLILHYLNSTIHEIGLQEIFALVPSTTSRYITFGLKILLQTLRSMPDASIKWPKGDEFQGLNDLIRPRHPLLTGAFASIDGLCLPVQTACNQDIENATYNGWLHEHFLRTEHPTGLVLSAHINAPGSWHDSRIAQPIYRSLENQTPKGFYLVADAAFPRGTKSTDGYIRAPFKSGDQITGTQVAIHDAIQFNRQLLSYRQTAEWGNRGLQGSFGCLRVPLDATNIDRRGDIIETCLRGYCLRTRRVGLNQIQSVYVGEWASNGQEMRIWSDFENMLFAEQRRHDHVLRFYLTARYE